MVSTSGLFLPLIVLFCGVGNQTQGHVLAWEVLYHRATSSVLEFIMTRGLMGIRFFIFHVEVHVSVQQQIHGLRWLQHHHIPASGMGESRVGCSCSFKNTPQDSYLCSVV